MMLIMGTATAWGASETYTVTEWTGSTGNKSFNMLDNVVTVNAYIQSKTYNNTNSQNVAYVDGSNMLRFTATSACISSITLTANTDNNSNTKTIKYATSDDGSTWSDYTTPADTYSPRNSTPSTHTINFATPVQYVRFLQGDNNAISVGVITVTTSGGSTPSISADDVNIAAAGTSGSISYTINNPVEGGAVTAAKTGTADWLTVGTVSASSVALTTTANEGSERSATVRLTYTYNTNETVTKDVTVTQAGAVSGYTITYDVNTMYNSETKMATTINPVAGQTALPSTLPTPDDVKQGYTFEGWYTNSDLTTKATAGAAIAANTTLYANYTINSATLSPASGDKMYSQETITITPPTGVTMTGIKYKWSSGSFSNKTKLLDSGTYLATSSTFTGSNAVGDTRKLSLILTDGKWWSASVIQATYNVKYKVTYDGNGNTGGTAPTDAGRYAKNATPTVLDNTGSLVKTNYSFDGWNTANDGSGVNYAAGATLPAMTANVTLYAKWVAASTYTLTINGNGGSGGSASVTATLNQALPSFTAPVRAGYLLKGYYTESSNGTKVINADGTLVASVSGWTNGSAQWIKASNETLYAQWDAIYTVTFDATTNGGSCATASLTQESADASIILPNASKEGNTFSGWYTTASGEGTRAGGAAGTYKPTSNITLYARFAEATSTVKFKMVRVGTTDASTAANADPHTLISDEATITGTPGGTATVCRTDKSVGKYLSTNNSGTFIFNNGNLYYQITLASGSFAEGDVISYTGYSSKEIYITATATVPSSGAATTSGYSYTIPAGSPLIGQPSIYLWRASGSATYFNDLTVTSSGGGGAVSTYSVTFDLNGKADEIEALSEQTNLPNPLPTPDNVTAGYTFEGWYTDDEFTIRATAGAALGADATLYANYTMDAPTISQNGGAIYANTILTMTADAPFVSAFGWWTGADQAFDKNTAVNDRAHYQTYPSQGNPNEGDAIDSYQFTVPTTKHGTRYFSYMIFDGKFYSVPAITSAFTVSHLITITTQPKGATYVQNASATALSVVASVTGTDSDTGTLSYQWKSSSDNENWSIASGTSTNATYSPSTAATGTTYYKCVVSSNNGAAEVESDIVAVTVNAAALFTVSFDKGICTTANLSKTSETQQNQNDPITLATVSNTGSDYSFEGWYDENDNKITTSIIPSGNITLTAKYLCKVTFSASGEGTVTAVKVSNGSAISNGDKVLEGESVTFTANSKVTTLSAWGGDASGTTNPLTIEINDKKNVTATFATSDNSLLFYTDFITADGWTNGNITDSSTSSANFTIKSSVMANSAKVSFACSKGSSDSHVTKVNTSTGKLTFDSKSNLTVNNGKADHYMAIELSGVNGSLDIEFGDASATKWVYAYDDGGTGTVSDRTQLGSKVTKFTIDNLTSSKVILYLGQQNSTIGELTITTPKTKLTVDPSEVTIIGASGKTATVRVVTNSPSIPTASSSDESVATVSYNSSTKIATITSEGEGNATVTINVAAGGGYPAKSATVSVSVEAAAIKIATQPSNLAFYQNDAAAKTFTVSASANTGADLNYQWYACNSDGGSATLIPGAIEPTYTLNTTQKATTGDSYYKCYITTADGSCPETYTNVVCASVSALVAGTYNATVFVGTKGNTLTYTGLTGWNIDGGNTTTAHSTSSFSEGTLTIGGSSVGTDKVVLTKDAETITINVTVKKHTLTLVWSKSKVEYKASDLTVNNPFTIGSGATDLPTLTRLYEDGDPYTGEIQYYTDDVTIVYFGDSGSGSNTWTKPSDEDTKPTIRYGGGQGGAVIYAYVPDNASDVEAVKATYDLRIQNGYSNDLPSGRKVSVQQQYTMYIPNTDTKLITVTYGGYKYNGATWSGKTDAWGTATNYVGKENVIDGYAYAVRNKERDASDEYMNAIHESDDFGSAWYDPSDEGNPGRVSAKYQRIKPFRLPCRASYVTFYAHQSGTLTAYVYQNGIIGRGGNANQLASGPRLGYWFDEEGWVQNPSAAVVSKQKIANNNARDKRIYDGKTNDQQMTAYWTNTGDDIMIKKLRSNWCSEEHPDKDTPASAFSDTYDATYKYHNPYYWGNYDEISANNALVVPTPETPVPHQGGHLIVNEGYVKYTIDVVAGKTYYFFGKMTKVGYAGMNFVPAGSENRKTTRLDLAANDDWSAKFGEEGEYLQGKATTIYDQITVPSNYRIGMWNTICLPFSVNENQVEQVFGKGTELAIFNGLRHDTENHVYYIKYLRHVDQNILPGQPYLIYPTGKAVEERSNQDNGGMKETGEPVPTVGDIIGTGSVGNVKLTFHNVIINKGVTAKSYGCDVDAGGTTASYVFTGTDKPTDIVKYDIYNTPKTGELKRYMGSGTTLNTYHALMKAYSKDIKQDAITFAFSEDDVEKSWESNIDDDEPGDPTGIVIIEDEGTSDVRYSGKVTNGKSYNMMGQQVDPTSAKGIILINGKKVMY